MSILESLKQLLAEPKTRIELHDYIALLTQQIRSLLGEDRFGTNGTVTNESFVARLREYEATVAPLLTVEMLLGRWSCGEETEFATIPARRLAVGIDPKGGMTYLIASRWYPLYLVLYAACIGSVAANHYEVFYKVSHASVPNLTNLEFGGSLLVASNKAMSDIGDGFKLFPEMNDKKTPRSDYIYSLLEPHAEAALYLGPEYDSIFDKVEILLSTELLHLEHPSPVGQDERLLAFVGRFGWKRRSGTRIQDLVLEAHEAGKNWPPAVAGLFGGSAERFIELAEGSVRFLSQNAFWW